MRMEMNKLYFQTRFGDLQNLASHSMAQTVPADPLPCLQPYAPSAIVQIGITDAELCPPYGLEPQQIWGAILSPMLRQASAISQSGILLPVRYYYLPEPHESRRSFDSHNVQSQDSLLSTRGSRYLRRLCFFRSVLSFRLGALVSPILWAGRNDVAEA
jgi:hypothetical protein